MAFPELSDDQLERLTAYGTRHTTRAGEVLVAEGQPEYDMFVVLAGSVGVYEDIEGRRANIFDEQIGPMHFSGEMGLLLGEATYGSVVATSDGEVLHVPRAAVLEIVSSDADLSQLFLRAFAARRQLDSDAGTGLRIIGRRQDRNALRLAEFAQRNYLPWTWLDPDEARALELLTRAHRIPAQAKATPVVMWGTDMVLDGPSNRDVALMVGIGVSPVINDVADLVVVGAGPAGLAAAVYGASEGLSTYVVDDTGAGGQAANSARIENYLGFPAGLSGTELASRAIVQAQRLGARFLVPYRVQQLSTEVAEGGEADTELHLRLDSGDVLRARSVIVATGADYRRLALDNLGDFEGAGVYYAATAIEARVCGDETVIVIGGGNSAGQASLFLADHARHVILALRGGDIRKGMSEYLVRRVLNHPRITVSLHTEVTGLHGDPGDLHGVTITTRGTAERISTLAVFSFIGAEPRTDWLTDIDVDTHGFIRTGPGLSGAETREADPRRADTLPFETNIPGVFAVGDIRSGSTKRVAGAVGEASVCVSDIHRYLRF